MKKMKKLFISTMLGLSLAGMLCACSSSSTSTSSSTDEDASEAADEDTSEASSDDEDDDTLWAFNYTASEYVTLGDYLGLEYTEVDTSVTDEEVEEEIASILAAYAEAEQITDRAVEDGDTVNIDFEGLLDGEAFDGGSSEGYSLIIGSGSFIDGFEDGLIGVMPGETVSLELTFPETYTVNTDLAGQDVVFNVTVNYIEGDEVDPELTDEFVESLYVDDVTTVDDLYAYVLDYLVQDKIDDADSTIQSELIELALENAEVSYPQDLYDQYRDEYYNYYMEYYEYYASYFGMEVDEFLETYVGGTEEDILAEAEEYAEYYAEHLLLICAIAEAEGIEVSDDFYEEKITEYAELYGFEDADEIQEYYGKNYLIQAILNEVVLTLLQENGIAVQ